jgi:hypothetical protein
MPSQATTADAVALEPSAKLRESSPVDDSSDTATKKFPKDAVDGGISLMSSSRNLARWKHARPGLGDPV